MTVNLTAVGAELRRLREARSWSIRDLSDKTGISRPFISQIELNHNTGSLKAFSLIADALGVRLSTIIRNAENRPEAKAVARQWPTDTIGETLVSLSEGRE